MTMDPIPTMEQFERRLKRRAQDFDYNYQILVNEGLAELRKKHKAEEEIFTQKMHEKYLEQKEENENRTTMKDKPERYS
jgi:hypothetical protein